MRYSRRASSFARKVDEPGTLVDVRRYPDGEVKVHAVSLHEEELLRSDVAVSYLYGIQGPQLIVITPFSGGRAEEPVLLRVTS